MKDTITNKVKLVRACPISMGDARRWFEDQGTRPTSTEHLWEVHQRLVADWANGMLRMVDDMKYMGMTGSTSKSGYSAEIILDDTNDIIERIRPYLSTFPNKTKFISVCEVVKNSNLPESTSHKTVGRALRRLGWRVIADPRKPI